MKKSNPFARAMAMVAALSGLISQGMSAAAAISTVGHYESRGHGRGKRTGKESGNNCTNWKARLNGQTNGKRECARRMRQIERGIIAVSA